jgi:DNA-binding transcriptional regulator YiaG
MIRSNAEISLAELAAEVGVSPSTIFRWESGIRSPHGPAAVRYVVLLDRIASETP